MENFKECISIILSRWSAVKLAHDLDLGGDPNSTMLKINHLKDSIYTFFQDYSTNADEYDLSDNLSDYLSEEFGVLLEDNSHFQVSKSLIDHYNQIVILGRVEILKALKNAPVTAAEYKDESSDDASDDGSVMSEKMEMDVEMEIDQEMASRKPIVDEEGFTLMMRETQLAQEFMEQFMIDTLEFEKSPSKDCFSRIQKAFNDAMDYLTPYDQKTCLQKLTIIKALLVPKTKKFSFSKKLPAASVAMVNNAAAVDEPQIQSQSPQGAFVLNGISNHDFSPSEDGEKDVYLYDLENCRVDLRGINVAAVHLRNMNNCLVISNPIQGSLLGHACVESTLVLGCKQFRIHDSSHVYAFLCIPSDPIIEDCTDMVFGDYPLEIIDGWYKTIQNYFDQVKDFNWHKKGQSPNWSLASDSNYKDLKIKL